MCEAQLLRFCLVAYFVSYLFTSFWVCYTCPIIEFKVLVRPCSFLLICLVGIAWEFNLMLPGCIDMFNHLR